ncbi:MAG: helix-turn-helix domain-containing protein [Desulfobulbaceae bacterium]|nr:helix-turn-helix domain-containing protein [Desulfobulbaceae bacterium]
MQEKKCESNIPGRIKYVRSTLGHTQKQFADILECDQAAVSRFEKGQRQLDACALLALFEKCHLNINWLLSGEGDIWLNNAPGKKQGTSEASSELKEIEEWLSEEGEEDPDTWSWFRVQCKKKFPDFAEWLKKHDEAETETNNFKIAL